MLHNEWLKMEASLNLPARPDVLSTRTFRHLAEWIMYAVSRYPRPPRPPVSKTLRCFGWTNGANLSTLSAWCWFVKMFLMRKFFPWKRVGLNAVFDMAKLTRGLNCTSATFAVPCALNDRSSTPSISAQQIHFSVWLNFWQESGFDGPWFGAHLRELNLAFVGNSTWATHHAIRIDACDTVEDISGDDL